MKIYSKIKVRIFQFKRSISMIIMILKHFLNYNTIFKLTLFCLSTYYKKSLSDVSNILVDTNIQIFHE